MTRLLIGCLLSLIAFCAWSEPTAGAVASNTNEVLEVIVNIIVVILYVAAMAVFVSACMKYRIHRQNPQQIPLSTPLTELVLAIILAALPTVTKMTNEHLFKEEPQLIKSQATPRGPTGVQPYRPPQYQPPQR